MMAAFRLDSVSPTLAESFRRAPTAKRRKAARLACEIAASSVGLHDKEVLLALEALRSDAPVAPAVPEQLERLATSFDDAYLGIEDQGDEAKKPEALRFFSKARAASAVMFALSNDAAQLHEAIYEAIAALEDPAELVRSVAAVLG